jgi:hypothetical protein
VAIGNGRHNVWKASAAAVSIAGFMIAGSLRADEPETLRPGMPAMQADIANLKAAETFTLGGTPDWMALTSDAGWVANAKLKVVQRIDPQTNKITTVIPMPDTPCSGLAAGFYGFRSAASPPRLPASISPRTRSSVLGSRRLAGPGRIERASLTFRWARQRARCRPSGSMQTSVEMT